MTTSPPPSTRPSVKTTPPAGPLARALARAWLWFFGWKVEGELPPGIKAVAIAYPHTTNWDMPFMLAVAYRLGVRPSWLGKRQIFRTPFGGFMRWLGGIPVDRSARTNMVAQVVERFAGIDRLFLVVPPSATRHKAAHWKSGFYHIARGAGVPILCTFLDYTRKVGGIGAVVHPTGDVRADMDVIRAFYQGIEGRYPENQTPIYLPEEDPPQARAAGGAGPVG
ncbi:MAG: lysophospholipid acyltransferase family protein [Deltaproteobacteria bacterium]|nr:lysophospholipid acyltransferase family protein [Deltaproteobacteria bacterium]